MDENKVDLDEVIRFMEWFEKQGYKVTRWWEGEFSGPMQSSSGFYEPKESIEEIIDKYEFDVVWSKEETEEEASIYDDGFKPSSIPNTSTS